MTASRGPSTRPSWGWQDDAACRGEDLVLFFGPGAERQPERDVRERKAKAICSQCPVRSECLDYALSRPEKYGIWSLNEDERASERRRRVRRGDYSPQTAPPDVVDKQCHGCEETLPADAFPLDKRSSDGLNSRCRKCTNESERVRRAARQVVA